MISDAVDLIAVCRQQNIPMRGHTDERSHFQVFLKYGAEGELLKQYVQNAPANTKYCTLLEIKVLSRTIKGSPACPHRVTLIGSS